MTAYIALEPNEHMHERLREKARESGFEEADGSLLILSCGMEDVDQIGDILDDWARRWGREVKDGKTVDTILSILTLCSVPARPSTSTKHSSAAHSTPPAETIRALQTRVLRPGGQLLFYEHVRSPIPTIARAQDIVAPIWRLFFDGCTIGVDAVRASWEAGFEKPDTDPREMNSLLWSEDDRGVRSWRVESGENGWAEMFTWGNKGEQPESLFWHQSGRCRKRL